MPRLPEWSLDVAIENNFQLRGNFQSTTNTSQLAMSYIGPTIWNKTPYTLKLFLYKFLTIKNSHFHL